MKDNTDLVVQCACTVSRHFSGVKNLSDIQMLATPAVISKIRVRLSIVLDLPITKNAIAEKLTLCECANRLKRDHYILRCTCALIFKIRNGTQ
jgi:hypothetical protein